MPTKAPVWIPLFPLHAVLFPNGILPLKIFEARYADMVRACMENKTPFGIALIKSDQQADGAEAPETIGCLAHVTQCDAITPEVVLLRVKGGDRFRILETRELPDQRLAARIETIAADNSAPVSAIHLGCAKALKIVIEDINAKGLTEQGAAFESPFSLPIQLNDAGWVANRWCEILPIPLKARQKLLELNDAQSRITVVHKYLQQHKILQS